MPWNLAATAAATDVWEVLQAALEAQGDLADLDRAHADAAIRALTPLVKAGAAGSADVAVEVSGTTEPGSEQITLVIRTHHAQQPRPAAAPA